MDRSFATPLVFTYVDRNGRTGQFSVPVTIGMCRGTDRCTPPGWRDLPCARWAKELDETHDLTPAEVRTAHHAALNREPQRVW